MNTASMIIADFRPELSHLLGEHLPFVLGWPFFGLSLGLVYLLGTESKLSDVMITEDGKPTLFFMLSAATYGPLMFATVFLFSPFIMITLAVQSTRKRWAERREDLALNSEQESRWITDEPEPLLQSVLEKEAELLEQVMEELSEAKSICMRRQEKDDSIETTGRDLVMLSDELRRRQNLYLEAESAIQDQLLDEPF